MGAWTQPAQTGKGARGRASRLKRMYTELSMENDAMKAVIQRSGAPDEKRESYRR